MRVIILSDTHLMHSQVKVPDGDLLIHCGDYTNKGSNSDTLDFLNWFSAHNHSYKVWINGNHELGHDKGPMRQSKIDLYKSFTDKNKNLFYLEHSSIMIDGFKIFGSPFTPFFYNWAYNVARGAEIASKWADIPDDTNILVTHGPVYGILDLVKDNFHNSGRDLHQGCEELLKRVNQLKQLKLHAGGHLHLQGGQTKVVNGITFVNAAICTEDYQPTNLPVVIDL